MAAYIHIIHVIGGKCKPGLAAFLVLVMLLSLAGFPPVQAQNSEGETKTFNISAIDVEITINRFGDRDPQGKMYVLEAGSDANGNGQDDAIDAIRAQEVAPLPDRVSTGLRNDPIQPLVIRANISDTVVINFTNRLGSGRVGIHIQGLPVDPFITGSNVGFNPDTTVGIGNSIIYTWKIPDQRNMEGSYVFTSLGTDMRQQQAHGLFGVLNIEPKGSVYLSPITGQPVKSGWDAMIVDPNGKDFREDTIIYHEFGDESFKILDRGGNALPLKDPFNEDAYRPGSRLLNYRSEPFFHRQELVVPILGHIDPSQNYGSYMFGDPATPRPRGYIGDPTKRRIVHAGSERFHVDHLHGGSIRWQFDPFATEPEELPGGVDFFGLTATKNPPAQTRSQRIDSQAIGPLETYTEQIEGGAGGLQSGTGEFLFHCHFGHHYTVGMWSFWRVFDTLQTGEPWQVGPFPLQELPDRQGMIPVAMDSTQLIGMTMPSGRTLTDGPTTDITLDIDEWLRTNVPPQGDPGPKTDYDASVWNWLRVDDVSQLDQLALGDSTIPTSFLLQSLGFDPASSGPLYLGEPETIINWNTNIDGDPDLRWPNYQAPPGAAGKRLPIMFNPTNARPAFPLLRPHLGRRPPFAPMRSGSPWLGDPDENFPEEHPNSLIPQDARRLEYVVDTIPLSININEEFAIQNRDAALGVLDEDKADILSGNKTAEQLTIRANVGDGIDIIHYTSIPQATFEFFKSNLHFHFVQFDTQASDGVITGMSYEQSVAPYSANRIRLLEGVAAGSTSIAVDDASRLKVNAFIGIGFGVPRRNRDGGNLPGTLNSNGGFEWVQIMAKDEATGILTLDRPLLNNHLVGQFVSTEFMRQQLYADAESGTTYFHNHVFAVPGFGLSLAMALIQEPQGSTWHDPATGEEIRSGTIADIKNVNVPVSPGIPIQDFREFVLHQMEAITGIGEGAGGEPGGFNLRQEPLLERLNIGVGEPAHFFSSVLYGDPATPLLRTYVGDLAVIRLLGSSGHDMGAFHMAGHRFRVSRFNPDEVPRDTVMLGISERFDLFFTAGSVGLQAGDYIYMNSMGEKTMDGAWGILRVHDSLQPDLQPIQNFFPPIGGSFPQNAETGSVPPPADEITSVAELKAVLEINGYELMGGIPIEDIPVRTYDVVAEDKNIEFSRDFIKPSGRVYVLAEDLEDMRFNRIPLEPLVLRANIGEIVRINFTNNVDGARASFHIPELIYPTRSGGAAFGLNDDSTVAPGGSRTYWYVIDPRFEVPRSFGIMDFGDPIDGTSNGLYGMFIVEPAGTTYHDPLTGEEVKSGTIVDVRNPSFPQGEFREAVLIFHDDDRG